MEYRKTIILKDGRECLLRNGTEQDGQALLDIFNLTHEQTDFLLTYPGEQSMTAGDEAKFLKEMQESAGGIELLAELDGKIIGSAGWHRRDRARRRSSSARGLQIRR